MSKYIDVDEFSEMVLNDWDILDYADVLKAMRDFPAADVRENEHGEWTKIHWKAFRCSECKGISEYYTNFCPNCGASMWKGEKDG